MRSNRNLCSRRAGACDAGSGRAERLRSNLHPGFTILEAIVVIAIVAIIGTILLSSDTPESKNDRQRYDEASDALDSLTQAIVGNEPTKGQTSFRWVVGAYPGQLSDLTTKITAAGKTICGTFYSAAMVTNWTNPFWTKEFSTNGSILVKGFTMQNALVRLSSVPALGQNQADTFAIRMPSVALTDAKGLDLAVDGTIDGTAGIVRYSATDPTQVDYWILGSGC